MNPSRVIVLAPLLCFAIFIDAFTFLISLALSVVTAVPGTAAGCAVGQYYAGWLGCLVFGGIGSLLNVAAVATEPIGIVLGVAITICINFTLGSMLILFLRLAHMFDGKAAVGAMLGEGIPGISMLPLWSGLIIYCAYRQAKQEMLGQALGNTGSILGVSAIRAVNPAVGAALVAGQRMGASQAVLAAGGPSVEEDEREVARNIRNQELATAKTNLKASVDRLKAGMGSDITPKAQPSYGQKIPA